MRLHHVTLLVPDLTAAAAFYEREFGLERIPKEGLDYPGAFYHLNDHQQLHLAELPDGMPSFRGHFCLKVADFSKVFWRMRELGLLDLSPWGKVRELPDGSMQLYFRDPGGNLVEVCSEAGDRGGIDAGIFEVGEFGGGAYRYGNAP